jgi:hypothetical protein
MGSLDIAAIRTSGQLYRGNKEVTSCEKLNQALYDLSRGGVGYSPAEWAALPASEKDHMESEFQAGRNKTPQGL